MEAPELKPCPFCGTPPSMEKIDYVYCDNPLCPMKGVDSFRLDAWNNRHTYRQARESAYGVKVKPLDMPERRNGYWGDKDGYQVAHTRDDLFRVRFHGKVICRDIRGFDRAVEWANKHNEARIKAALEVA